MTLGYNNTSQPRREPNRNETIFTFLIFSGIVGLAFSHIELNANGKQVPDSPKTVYNSSSSSVASADATDAKHATSVASHMKILISKEVPEANQPICFHLENCSPEVNYFLEFEDGTKKPFVNGSLQHKFTHDGYSTVKIWASYKNETKLLQSKQFWVARAVDKPTELLTLL